MEIDDKKKAREKKEKFVLNLHLLSSNIFIMPMDMLRVVTFKNRRRNRELKDGDVEEKLRRIL